MFVIFLTLNVPIPDKKKKLTEMFILTLLCSASIGFMKALKAFIKPFEAPQRNVKIISIQLSEMHRMLRVKLSQISFRNSHTSGYDLQVMKNHCSI